MIPSEKDKMDCLRLAVSVIIPRHTVEARSAADMIVTMAAKFYEFVSKDEPRK